MIRQYAAEKLRTSGEAEAARDDHARHYLSLAIRVFAQTLTLSDYDALFQLEAETPNIAAAGRWLLVTDRAVELLAFFDDLPFLDPFAWPPTTLDELGAIATDAIDMADAQKLRGYESACWVAGDRAFFEGDLVEYRRITDLARASSNGEHAAATSIQAATVALFDGDVESALKSSRAATARARLDRDSPLLAWSLAYEVAPESMLETGFAPAIAEEALAVARRTGGTVTLLYPLVGVMTATKRLDPARALLAAEESMRCDRTRRRRFLNMGRAASATIRLGRGEIAHGLTLWREVVCSLDHDGDRSVLSVQLAALADALAAVDPRTAINIAANSESDAIAHFPAFEIQPELKLLAECHPADVASARARFVALGYDAAISFVHAAVDQVIAEHGPPTITA
ncbi:MAG TPA: hypothetical protein VM282_22560 [Acidimicrobiales bacterium]|nr:hypothetical protein [Acidimicrobiales bacterium]